MTKSNSIVWIVLGFIALFTAIALAFSGIVDTILPVFPFVSEIVTVVYLVCLLLFIVADRLISGSSGRFALLAFLTLVTVSIIHMSSGVLQLSTLLPFSSPVFLYCLLALVTGAAASLPIIVIICVTVIIGEAGNAVMILVGAGTVGPVAMLKAAKELVPLAGCLFIFSGIAHMVLRREIHDSDGLKAARKSGSSPVPVQDSKFITVSASKPLEKTQSFKLNYDSELADIGEGKVEELLSSVVYFMSRNFSSYSSLGFIYNPQERCFILNAYHSKSMNIQRGITVPLGNGIIGRIGTEGRSFMSGDLPLYNQDVLYYGGKEMINSIIAVPVISHEKELLGVLLIDSKNKNAFTDQHKDGMRRFSQLAAALITNARMRIYQEKTANEFRIFYQASQQFSTVLSTLEVIDVLMKIIPSLTNAVRVMTILFDSRKKNAFIFKIQGDAMELKERLEFPLNEGIYAYAFKNRNIVNIGDFQQAQSKYYRFVPDEQKNSRIKSLVALPILDDQSRTVGVVSIEGEQENQFHGEMEQILSILVFNASIAFSKALLYQKMETLATTDGLTGLNNHRNFQELLTQEINRSVRYSRPLSLLLMDIDHFKSFNDTYGHPVGDLVLKEISKCIKSSLRANDIPARYGGEEFTVIAPECDGNGARIIAERIRSTIEAHVIHSLEKELRVTVSIGYATLPQHASVQKELIDCADKALYYSKETGRNRISQYEKGMSGKNK